MNKQTRRDFLKTIGLFSSTVFLSNIGCSRYSKIEKPNILFIMLDDLGKEWVSASGAQDIETPHVDKLAATGMQFSNVYCMPQCTPTRITLMTGQYPFRHGWINHWDVPRWGGGCHFDWRRNPSTARIMQSAGYKTAVAGKWQVNDFRVQPNALIYHGFDDYCMWTGYETGNPPSAERYWNPYIHTKEGSKTWTGRFGEDVFSDFLIDFMRENKSHPMFLYYPMCLPHGPVTHTPLEPTVKGLYPSYKAMVRYTDHILGKLLKALEDLNIRDKTIIFWTSDNGSPQGIDGHLNGRKVPGGKSLTTENGICVPFIVNCPGLVPKGVKSDALIDFTDILPTCADLGGAKMPQNVVSDGSSFAELILGNNDDSKRNWIMAMGGQNRARLTDQGVENEWKFRDRVIRNKRFKLYVNIKRKAEKLVDLLRDPAEEINLLSHPDPEIKAALAELSKVISQFPERDADPIYSPLPAQEWDVQITAKSQEWKK